MAFIYSIVCETTGLQYIGLTRETPESRFRGHRYNTKNGSKRKLAVSLREYGEENHTLTTIEETDYPEERECYWIDKLDTIENGLNSVPGGGVYPRLQKENHPLWGVGHSDAARAKIKANHAPCGGASNSRAKWATLYYEDGSSERTNCLKVWCRDRGYSLPAHRNRIEGAKGTNPRQHTHPHPKSGVCRIVYDKGVDTGNWSRGVL